MATAERLSGHRLTAFHGCYDMDQVTLHPNFSVSTTCDTAGGYRVSSMVRPLACDAVAPAPSNPCDGASGTGDLRVNLCELPADLGAFLLRNISCDGALALCGRLASADSSMSSACTWTQGGQTRLLRDTERTPGV